jgi:cyclophilin family peptidyl-prolyl cis-trans isomerase
VGKKSKAHQRNLARARAKRRKGRPKRRRRWDIKQVGIVVLIAAIAVSMVVFLIPGLTDLSPRIDDPPAADDMPPFEDEDDFAVGGVACDGEVPETAGELKPQWDEPPDMVIDPEATYRATLETSCGTIVLDLFAADAPRTVNNFVFLAGEGFYDGITFHRVSPGFVIQSGDPDGTGFGGPGYRFEDELDLAEERGYPRGTLAMANAGPDTNGSQFFIVSGSADQLQPLYSVFGEVAEGLDVVELIAQVPTVQETPTQTIYIERVIIEEVADNGEDEPDDEE